jgi:hypothetical protein
MKCSFCATGAMSKANLRNLSSGEIVEQVLQVPRACAPPFFPSRHNALQARRLLVAASADDSLQLSDSTDVDADDNDTGQSSSAQSLWYCLLALFLLLMPMLLLQPPLLLAAC